MEIWPTVWQPCHTMNSFHSEICTANMYDDDVLLLKVLKDHTAMLKSVGVKPSKKIFKIAKLYQIVRIKVVILFHKTQKNIVVMIDYEKVKKMYDPLVPLLNTINEVT